jgi:hypothetical protein
MVPADARPLPPAVTELRQRIEDWRSTRAKRGPMPKDLWSEAVHLTRRLGVYAISKALRLNYEALKGWAEDAPKKKEGRQAVYRKAAFVQLGPLPGIPSPSPSVEVETAGGKLTIRLPGMSAGEAIAIMDAFLRSRR